MKKLSKNGIGSSALGTPCLLNNQDYSSKDSIKTELLSKLHSNVSLKTALFYSCKAKSNILTMAALSSAVQ